MASSRAIAERHSGEKRAVTEAIIGIVEDKRHEVLERQQAGYFIHDRQDVGDQVRQIVRRQLLFPVDDNYSSLSATTTVLAKLI